MKPISKTLLSFIKTNFIKTTKIPNPRFSTLSKKFIHSLFELMFEGHRLLSSIELNVQHIKDQESIPKSYDYNYIPSNIRSTIDRMDKNAYVYRFSLQGKEYQVVFIYPVDSIYSENLFIKRIHKVIMWLYVANNFASNKCSQKMNIFMYFT